MHSGRSSAVSATFETMAKREPDERNRLERAQHDIRSGRWFRRVRAVLALAGNTDPRHRHLLRRAMADESLMIRHLAARVLAGTPMGAPEHELSALREAGVVESLTAEEIIKRGLWIFPSHEVVETLAVAATSESDRLQRAIYTHALGQTRSPAALTPLKALAADEDAGVRECAAEGLGLVGDPDAIPTVESLLSDVDRPVRRAAQHAIAALRATDDRREGLPDR